MDMIWVCARLWRWSIFNRRSKSLQCSCGWCHTTIFIFITLLLTSVHSAIRSASQQPECPEEWIESAQVCYKFVRAPENNFDQAQRMCRNSQADLVSIDNVGEHQFISRWLSDHDPQQKLWLTGGTDENRETWYWTGKTEDTPFTFQEGWLPDRKLVGDFLVYNFSRTRGEWGWDEADARIQKYPYICEIAKSDVDEMKHTARGHDFGVNVIEPDKVPHGPVMIQEPVDVV